MQLSLKGSPTFTLLCLQPKAQTEWVEAIGLLVANKPNVFFLRYALKTLG